MFRRKKKDQKAEAEAPIETSPDTATASAAVAETTVPDSPTVEHGDAAEALPETPIAAPPASQPAVSLTGPVDSRTRARARGNRVQKVGIVASDKMQKTVVVRVDRLVLHPKYRRYVRRTSKFMAHDELGASTGDRVRIVETRPLSANKHWRVVEILQKAAK